MNSDRPAGYKPAPRPESVAPPLPEGVLSVLELEMECSELRETIADLHERLDDLRRAAEQAGHDATADAEDRLGELILARESLSKMAEASAEVISAYRRMFGDSHLEPLGHDAGNLFRAIRDLENITD